MEFELKFSEIIMIIITSIFVRRYYCGITYFINLHVL